MGKAERVLKEIEVAERQSLPIVEPEKGRVLEDIIRELRPRRVLEVGTLIGYSAILMGKELGKESDLVTIEIHADEAEIAKKNIERASILPTVEVVVGDAKDVIPELEGSFDLVFIDAEKSEYIDYLRLTQNKLHEGSVVTADDAGILTRQMRDYLDYVRSSGRYRSRYVAVGEDGLEISVEL